METRAAEGALPACPRREAVEIDQRLLADLQDVEPQATVDREEVRKDLMEGRAPAMVGAEAQERPDQRLQLVVRADRISQADGDRPGHTVGDHALAAGGEVVRLVRPGLEVVERRAPVAAYERLHPDVILQGRPKGTRRQRGGSPATECPENAVGSRPMPDTEKEANCRGAEGSQKEQRTKPAQEPPPPRPRPG